MSKKVDIESGSFQLRFNVNGSVIWTQIGLAAMFIFLLVFVKNPKVHTACWAFLALDIISLIVSFMMGMKMSVSEADESTEQQQPASGPAPEVGEKKVSKKSSTQAVSGTIQNKAPLPNPAAVRPPVESAPAPASTQSTVPAPAPVQATQQAPKSEENNVMDVDTAVEQAGLTGRSVTELSDDEWAKLFGL